MRGKYRPSGAAPSSSSTGSAWGTLAAVSLSITCQVFPPLVATTDLFVTSPCIASITPHEKQQQLQAARNRFAAANKIVSYVSKTTRTQNCSHCSHRHLISQYNVAHPAPVPLAKTAQSPGQGDLVAVIFRLSPLNDHGISQRQPACASLLADQRCMGDWTEQSAVGQGGVRHW